MRVDDRKIGTDPTAESQPLHTDPGRYELVPHGQFESILLTQIFGIQDAKAS